MKKLTLYSVLLLILSSVVVFAQVQVGSISGRIFDPDGNRLAGVKVEVVSPVLLTRQEVITDASGYYRFTHLKPGIYELKVTSENFQMFRMTDIRVRVNDRLRFNINLVKIASETIVISGEAPLIQTEKTEVDRVLTREIVENMPVLGRDYTELIQLVPGITPQVDGNMRGPSVAGGRGRQVIWVVDGVENVDDYQGLNAVYLSQDAIEEVQVVQSGFSVVNGRGSAGVVNVVTKSGSDNFRGKFYGYYRDDSFDDHEDVPFRWLQGGVQAGGALIKGKTHYFAQFEYYDQYNKRKSVDPWGTVKYYEDDRDRQAYNIRLDHHLFENNVASVKFSYAPQNRLFPSTFSTRPIRDARVYDYANTNVTVNDSHMLSDEMVLESTFQYSEFGQEMSKNSDDPSDFFYYRWREGSAWKSERFGNAGTMDRKQKTYQFIEKLRKYMNSSSFGRMELTLGFDFKKVSFYYQYDDTYSYYYFNGFSPRDENAYPVYKRMYTGDARIEADVTQFALYLQNDWKLNDRLTMNIGLRYDRNNYWELNDWSPRFGAAYDLTGDGKTVVRGGVGIFKDRDILYRIQQVEKPVNTYFYPILVNGQWDGSSFRQSTPVTTTFWWEDEIKTPYVIDASIGIERELIPNYRLSATYMYKDGRDRWYSRWENIDRTAEDYDPEYRQKNFYGNQGKSKYHALVLELFKRYADNYSFSASYTWSRSTGNGYHYTAFLDNYVSRDPTLEDWRLQQWFRLNNDSPHQIKFYGTVMIPVIDVMFAGTYRYRSGYPFTAQNYSTGKLVGEINGYRNPSQKQIDMRAEKIIKIGRFTIKPKVDIFNLENRENVTALYSLENWPTFLKPRSWGPWRQFQAGFDFIW